MILKHLSHIQMICKMFCKKINKYNIDQDHGKLIVYDDMIADTNNKKKLNSTVTEFFIRVTNI